MSDQKYMRRALELAELGRYTVSPNPMVGCVIVRDGTIVGEGWHRRAGGAHAEIEALRSAGDSTGTTMYVTLEPCCHHGRTGPCTEAIRAAKPARVVVAMLDPFEPVNGKGVAALREAGIEVETGVLQDAARRMNETFVWSVTQKLPFVILKAAMTLDGKLATVARESQWITSAESRERSLALREEADAILVGSGTVKTDNPRLTRRLGLAGDRPWTRVVLDGDGEVPPHAQVLNATEQAKTILFARHPRHFATAPGFEIVAVEGRLDLRNVLAELHARGIRSVLVEGGSVIHSELIRRGLWQKMVLFIAPIIVGGGDAPAILTGEAVSRLTDAYRFRFDRLERVGDDLMVVAYP